MELQRGLRKLLFVLHLLQDGNDHVKLGSLGGVFVHAEPHQLTDMRRNPWRNCWPQPFQGHLSRRGGETREGFRQQLKVDEYLHPNSPSCRSPCARGQRRAPPWWPAPTATLQSSTCLQIDGWCPQVSSARLGKYKIWLKVCFSSGCRWHVAWFSAEQSLDQYKQKYMFSKEEVLRGDWECWWWGYLQGPSMLENTCVQDTGRRT